MLKGIGLFSVIVVAFSASRWLGFTLPIATEEPKRLNHDGRENAVLFEFHFLLKGRDGEWKTVQN